MFRRRRSGSGACPPASPRTTSTSMQLRPTFGKKRQRRSAQRQASRTRPQKGRCSTCRSTTGLAPSPRAHSSRSGNAGTAEWTSRYRCNECSVTVLCSRGSLESCDERKASLHCLSPADLAQLNRRSKTRPMLQQCNTAKRRKTIDARVDKERMRSCVVLLPGLAARVGK